MRIPLILRIAALVVAATAFYTYVGRLVPQKEVYPPAEVEMKANMSTDEMVKVGRQIMEGKTRQLCSAEVPGDTQRNLQVDATFSDQKFKHILVPVWLLTYTYGARVYQVATNGVTGKIAGDRPWSWIKIVLLMLNANQGN